MDVRSNLMEYVWRLRPASEYPQARASQDKLLIAALEAPKRALRASFRRLAEIRKRNQERMARERALAAWARGQWLMREWVNAPGNCNAISRAEIKRVRIPFADEAAPPLRDYAMMADIESARADIEADMRSAFTTIAASAPASQLEEWAVLACQPSGANLEQPYRVLASAKTMAEAEHLAGRARVSHPNYHTAVIRKRDILGGK